MSTPKKLHLGQHVTQLPGGTINALIDGGLKLLTKAAPAAAPTPSAAKSTVIVRLKWAGEEQLPAGSTVKLGAAIFDPTDDPSAPFTGLQFNCSEPGVADQDAHVAVTTAPIKAGAVGYGHIPQATWAKVDVQSESHAFAVVTAATTLESAASGRFPIIWKQAGTGVKWAVLAIGGSGGGDTILTGLLYETIPAGEVLDVCITLDSWDSAANTYVLTTTADPEDRVAGINGDPYQPIRGSSGKPVRIWGTAKQATLPTDPEDEESEPILKSAIEILRWSIAQLPGHDTAERQGPYKPEDSDAYQLGAGDDCTPTPP